MSYTQTEYAVLRKYRLINEDSSLVQVKLERPLDKPLGEGDKMELDAIKRLLQANKVEPTEPWLDWIFFQAGGGKHAVDARDRAMEQTKDRFIKERLSGFTDYAGLVHAAVPKDEAEQRWVEAENSWKEELISVDQDIVDHLGVFGFYRAWPGRDKLYERVEKAVKAFQALVLDGSIAKMNAEIAATSGTPMSTEPKDYESLDDVEKASKRVTRYFACKVAREDIRVAKVFETDYVRAVCPQTYAASVRYGFDNWAFSNRANFEEVLTTDQSFRDAWKQHAQKNLMVFITWKIPMPTNIVRKDNTFNRFGMANMALMLPIDASGKIGTEVTFRDEENASPMSFKQVVQCIEAEPARATDPAAEEMPVKRGPNAYASPFEADLRVRELRELLKRVDEWSETFDLSSVNTDVYSSIKSSAE